MRIVIFGGTGNLGTALARRLVPEHDVRIVARRLPAVPEQAIPGADWYEADVTEDDLVPAVADADVMVHLAWTFHPTRDPGQTWQVNVIGTERVLAAAEQARTPAVVCSSSVAAYSPRSDLQPVDESFPTHGTGSSAYAREKSYVERLLDSFALRNPQTRTVRMRPAFVFQREAAAEQWRLFVANPKFRRLFDTRLAPALPLPRDLMLQAVHADDLTEAFVAAIEGEAVGAYNLAVDDVLGGADVSSLLNARPFFVETQRMRQLVSMAWKAHASKAPPDLFDTMMSLPVMSTQRARDDLGWRPRTTAASAIGSFLSGTADRESGPTPALAEDPMPADEHTSKQELYDRARELDIDGRSSMNKDELIAALRRAAATEHT